MGGRGTPSPSHNISTGPMSFLGGNPVTSPRSGCGVPPSWGTLSPSSRLGWGGTPWWESPPPPPPGMGYPPPPPPPPDRTADGVLDTPRSVCLLRSRRRTFLFDFIVLLTNCSLDLQMNLKHLVVFSEFRTALMVAAEFGNKEVCEILVRRGANTLFADDHGTASLICSLSSSFPLNHH